MEYSRIQWLGMQQLTICENSFTLLLIYALEVYFLTSKSGISSNYTEA